MQTQVLRLTGALALSVGGILAARPSKNDQPIAPVVVSSLGAERGAIDVLAVIHHGVIDYSQLGVNHATDPAVKEFAAMMVKDHRAALQATYGLASKLDLSPEMSKKAADLDKEFKKDIADLKAKKDGRDLDKEFMDEQIDLHEEAIDDLKQLEKETTDATLKSAITTTLTKMQPHLDRAKAVRKSFG